jgi:RHS repeat-associated protein
VLWIEHSERGHQNITLGALCAAFGRNPSRSTAYRHYIPAGNNTVVYTRLSTGTNSTYYLTKDHLGSTAVITDSTGASLVSEKFSALGWNENTGSQQSTMATVSRHEFTGHEGLDNAGLNMVNMNGRIYIPSGSHFISPDPYVPDPGNTQSFNRYSYVNNNPLTLIDPAGFDDAAPCEGDDCLSEVEVIGHYIYEGGSSVVSWIDGVFKSAWDHLFRGGSAHLSPAQQKIATAELSNAQNLQGTPTTIASSDGNFRIELESPSVQAPQVTPPLAEVTVTSEFTGPGALTTPPPELTLVVEPPTAIHNFGAQVAANIQSNQALLEQSKNLSLENSNYWSIVGQSMARSGPKALNTALVLATLIPVLDIGADEVLAARGTIAAEDAIRLHHAWPKYLGGAAKRDLSPLSQSLHNTFHSGLDKILPRQWGDQLLRESWSSGKAAGAPRP